MNIPLRLFMVLSLVLAFASRGNAQELTIKSSFNPSESGSLCSLAFDEATGDMFVYPCNGTTIDRYTDSGDFLGTIPRPGEAANDVDMDFASVEVQLGNTVVPAGSLLFFNGEVGAVDVYAIDITTSEVIASITPGFGSSHVVGGSHHPTRDNLFMVQDSVPGGTLGNLIAEVDPTSGIAVNTFPVDEQGFSVFFGDLDVSITDGSLYVVSSVRSHIAVFDAENGLQNEGIPLPEGVSGLSGIAIDDPTGDLWVANTSGTVWQLGAFEPTRLCGDFDLDGDVDSADRTIQTVGWTGALLEGGTATFFDGDCDRDGDVDTADQNALILNWTGAQLGAGSGGTAATSIAVPEPDGLALGLLAIAIISFRSKGRARHR